MKGAGVLPSLVESVFLILPFKIKMFKIKKELLILSMCDFKMHHKTINIFGEKAALFILSVISTAAQPILTQHMLTATRAMERKTRDIAVHSNGQFFFTAMADHGDSH